jgi:hypothetical protein
MKTGIDIQKQIRQKLSAIQKAVADYLNAKVLLLSHAQLKTGLVFYCLLFSIANGYVLLYSMHQHYAVAGFSTSFSLLSAPKGKQLNSPVITKEEYEKVESFKSSISRLNKISYDSLIRARPQLLDSISVVEKIYLSPYKK